MSMCWHQVPSSVLHLFLSGSLPEPGAYIFLPSLEMNNPSSSPPLSALSPPDPPVSTCLGARVIDVHSCRDPNSGPHGMQPAPLTVELPLLTPASMTTCPL